MKRFILTVPFLFGCVIAAQAQDPLGSLVSSLKGTCTSFDYSYKVSGDFPLTGSGVIVLQGDAFSMSGNGLDVVCDGTTRWTVDRTAEECYIETVGDTSGLDISSDPALILGSLDSFFTKGSARKSTFAGRPTTAVSLTPASKDTGVDSAVAHFLGDGSICALVLELSAGSTVSIELSGMKQKTPEALAPTFTLDVSSLGKNYIVTDLR